MIFLYQTKQKVLFRGQWPKPKGKFKTFEIIVIYSAATSYDIIYIYERKTNKLEGTNILSRLT